jgi:hypothetical protein
MEPDSLVRFLGAVLMFLGAGVAGFGYSIPWLMRAPARARGCAHRLAGTLRGSLPSAPRLPRDLLRWGRAGAGHLCVAVTRWGP